MNFKDVYIHWNLYIALEDDLEKISRFIEFHNNNLNTFSIELSRLLLSASSEVDVILKQICKKINPENNSNNINQYRKSIKEYLPNLCKQKVYINRYGLEFKPFENWELTEKENPEWWKSYNNIKHQRNNYFNEANLKNTINSLGALLITTIYYYQLEFKGTIDRTININRTTERLSPTSKLLRLNSLYYQNPVYFYKPIEDDKD